VLDVDPQFDWNLLGDASRAMSLFDSRKLIDLRLPTGRPGKDGSAAIIEFCQSPPPDTMLLVTTNDWSRKHEGAWVDALAKVGVVVPVWPLRADELPVWIGARMASRGLKATTAAIALLADRVEGNLLAAAQEIDKLALLYTGEMLDVETLEANVADDARYDVFRLTDAAIGGDAGRALHIVGGLRAEGEELIPLLGWVVNQLRVLVRVSSAGSNIPLALSKEYIKPDKRKELFSHALKVGGRAHWEHCLAQAGRIDRIAKGRGDGDAWRELERLIAAIAKPRSAAGLLAP
jgi:DNA polymerase-3 subunit delta